MIGSQLPNYDDYTGNRPERNTATLAAFPTVPALLDELKRLTVESVALYSKLPKTFIARKGSYWSLAFGALQGDFHNDTHLEQMRAAIEAARKR
jgi:hypothetical protein